MALIGASITCVDQRTPTSPPTAAGSVGGAALLSSSITQTLLTSGTNPTNQKVYSTAAISPAPSALVTVAVLMRRSGGAISPTVTGGGMATWTQVASVDFGTIAAPTSRLIVFRALSAAPGSGAVTITFSSSVSNATWVVSQWSGVDASGVNGAGAIVQSGSSRGDGVNTLAATLGAFADANDVAYGVVGASLNGPAVNPGAGLTEIAEPSSGESTVLETEWGVNVNAIAASLSSAKNAALVDMEIRASGSGGGSSVSGSLSSVSANLSAFQAGTGSTTITVMVNDASGNPVSGATVVLSATGTGNTVTQPGDTTDATGVATGTLSSTVAGTKTVSAKANGTAITQTASVTVTPGPVSASQSTVVAAPTTITMGSGTSTITVTAKDATGNPISGAPVVLAVTGSGGTLTQPTATTNSSGVTTGTLSSTVDETETVSATIDGTPITQTAAVEVTMFSAAPITQTLLTAGSNPVNQKIYSTAAISPAPNALITVAVLMRRSSGALSPSLTGGGMSSWQTVTTVDFDTQGAPTKRLTIFRALSPSPGSGPITITFSGSVSNVQWIVSQWNGVETSGSNGSGAIVQTGTGRSDGATGLTVPLAAFGGASDVAYGVVGEAINGPTVAPAAGFTEIAEQSSGESSALEAEWATTQNTVGASWTGLTKAGILGVEIRAGNQGPVIPVAAVEVTPPVVEVLVGSTAQLTAALKDAGGEPLSGRTVTWSSDAPQFAKVSTTGLVTGVAVGPATITATSEGKSGTASVTVTASAEPVASVEVTPGSVSLVVGATAQLSATPKDANGQALTGRTITWGTSASGVATVSILGLVTAAGAGPATITATSEGKSGTASVTVTTGGMSALVGQWSAVRPAPIVQVHQHLLLDGRVLSFGGSSSIPQVFDPATGSFTAVPSPSLLFCSGHAFLPDGRLLVSGGGTGNGLGHPNADIFDPATASWIVGPNLTYARWYPTNTTLPNGEVVTMAGADESGNPVPIPEVGDGTSWRQLTGASLSLPNYPRNFVAPDGRLFNAGPSKQSQWLDFSGAGSWTPGPSMNYGSRTYGSAVMYEAGKIMFVGGNSSPTNSAEIIDLNQSNPQWTYTGSLSYARWNLNATVLPTGDVLVTGGVNGPRDNPALAVNATELWNPTSGTWTLMASSAALLRGYHSTSLLLPDGRVIHSGGGAGGGTVDNLNYEIYSPPYLFKGARPSVTGVTGTVGYGQTLTVQTPDGAAISKVTLIHFGSVTHAFDEAQRLISLTFSQGTGSLSVTLPSSRNIAPPGPYMLFLVNGNGVPSVARIIRLQ